MKKIKCTTVLGFLLLLAPYLKAQGFFEKGYVITPEMDTSYGFIANKSQHTNCLSCEFKKDSLSASEVYKPFELFAYRFSNGKYYISKNVNFDASNKALFLEYLIKGKLNIYVWRNKGVDIYFAEREGDTLIMLENPNRYFYFDAITMEFVKADEPNLQSTANYNKYKGTLKVLMSDTPELQAEINNLNLNSKSLIKISKKYHNLVCDNETCIIYEKNTRLKKNVGFSFGYTTFQVKEINTLFKTTTKIGSIFTPQIYFNNQLNILNQKMLVKLALSLTSIESISDMVNFRTLKFDGLLVSAPVSLQYEFTKTTFRPFVGLGFDIGVFTKRDVFELRTSTGFEQWDLNDYLTIGFERYNYGLFTTAGISYYNQNIQFTIAIDYGSYTLIKNQVKPYFGVAFQF
jgi:hypothetical protein